MLHNQRILITGASGFIGSHILERLQQDGTPGAGATVHALARTRGKLNELPHLNGFDFHECDLTDPVAVQSVVSKIRPQVILHLASAPDGKQSGGHSHTSIRSNIVATVNLLDAAAADGHTTAFVYGDSTKVYGASPAPYTAATPPAPNSAYSITKAAGWEFVKLYAERANFDAVALRPTLIYGPRQPVNLIGNLLHAVQARQPVFRLQGGSQTRSPLYIEDAVDAFLAAAERAESLNGRAINIGGPEELTIADIAETVVRCADGRMRIEHNGLMRDTDVSRSAVDLSEAEALMGWRPATPLAEGLRSLLNIDRVEVQNVAP